MRPQYTHDHFNPQVPCGTRRHRRGRRSRWWNFNPQVPCGTRPFFDFPSDDLTRFQSTGPLRDPTQDWTIRQLAGRFQSTGPLRDPTLLLEIRCLQSQISIHRSLAGPDPPITAPCSPRQQFQSTGPLRDPTSQTCLHGRSVRNFNPQVPCGTRHFCRRSVCSPIEFQSTGPLRDPTSGG